MADYTYQTRRKMTEDWVAHVKEKAGHLSKNEKQLLPGGSLPFSCPGTAGLDEGAF